MNTTSKIFVALATGLAAGAILGVLFAPDEGEETRKKIVDAGKNLVGAGKDLVDSAKKKVNNGSEKLSELKEEVFKKVEQMV